MKKSLISASLALGLLASSTSAFAATYEYSSKGRNFDKSWTAYNSGTNWAIEYGFNTDFINEDFTHTKHSTTRHIAKVRNANGTFSDQDSAGNWAGIEVTHSGSTVYYSITY
ncbi:hypothetical protein P9850_02250 [Anoxybacillus rupiensis]|uniref:Lactococcin 972 family bacteriocin n=1 Tax=Anoxybacteroides rupiense TaxID=311460 RepID=A0ABD5IT77_9BACL|nr:hypothetical protein [Anoxybacillus rupiensis]